MTTGSPSDGDLSTDDKDGRLVFGGIYRPLSASDRSDRLRRDHLKSASPRLLRNLDQQGLAIKFDSVHVAFAAAILQGLLSAPFSDDGHPALAMQCLRGDVRTIRHAAHVGLRGSNVH